MKSMKGTVTVAAIFIVALAVWDWWLKPTVGPAIAKVGN